MTRMAAGFRSLFSGTGRLCAAMLPLLGACQGAPQAGSGESETRQDPPTLADLRAAREQGLGYALSKMDEARAGLAADPGFWTLYADTTLDLFEESAAAGRPLAHLPEDAAESYAVALELDPARLDARAGLARALALSGRSAEAAAEAARAWEEHPDREAWSGAALLAVGRACLAWTAERVGAGGGVPAEAAIGALALEHAAARGEPGAFLPLSDLYAWQGLDEAAAEAAARGLRAGASADELYARLRGLGRRERNLQVAALEEVRRARPSDALLHWYLGEALFFQGQETRRAHDTLKAEECYDRATECFVLARSLEPGFATTCAEWLHLLQVQRAWLLREDARAPEAAEVAAAALEAAPERLEPAPDPESLRLAIDTIAFDLFSSGRLREAIGFLRRVCAAHDGDADWLNNLGFFLREHALALSSAGDGSAADLFEESWSAYSRAVQLSPEDARLINDRALIAVYYLGDRLELAERELHRSIQVGSRQLAEMSPDVPEAERRYVDEAVGDAWENLAYLQIVRRRSADRAEEFLEESVKHYPYARRNGVSALRQRLAELRREP